jgi:hypothetical protein
LTKFFLIATLILLVVGIPVSAIYWWVHSWAPGVWYSGYWNQWAHWVIIASVALAALWILYLIVWIIAKKRERKFHRDTGTALQSMNVSPSEPSGKRWYVKPDGTATDTLPPNASETISFVDPSEFINSQSPFEHGADFMMNERINRLLEEGKITIKEYEVCRRVTKNMDFLERESFLSAVEHRDETERQEHDRLPDSILKKYGIDPNMFRL